MVTPPGISQSNYEFKLNEEHAIDKGGKVLRVLAEMFIKILGFVLVTTAVYHIGGYWWFVLFIGILCMAPAKWFFD